MSDADRSGVFRVVVCGDEERQGELFGEVHGEHRADEHPTLRGDDSHRKGVARTAAQVSARALHLAYESQKEFHVEITGEQSSTVASRLWRGERSFTETYAGRLPPLRRALVRTFEDLLARGVSDEDAVAVVRARKVG